MIIDEAKTVATGEWMYDGIKPCRIIIKVEDLWPGSGDYEDPPEIFEDRHLPCLSVWYESPSSKGTFHSGGGYYLTVEDVLIGVQN